jgi:hypothetical protein
MFRQMRVWGGCTAALLALNCGSEPSSTGQGTLLGEPKALSHASVQNLDGGVCDVVVDGGDNVLSFATSEGNLSLSQVHRSSPSGGSVDEVTVKLDDKEIYHVVTKVESNGAFTIDIDYAPPLTRVKHVTITSTDGKTAVAVVDGKQTLPYEIKPNPDVRFPNGKAAPEVNVPPGIATKAAALFQKAGSESAACWQGAQSGEPRLESKSFSLKAAGPDFGHRSDPQDSLECISCIIGCDTAAAGCIAGAASAGGFCGPFLWICIPVGIGVCVAAGYGCKVGCDAAACCPETCGEDLCCNNDEECLSPQTGMCCSEGTNPCGGGAGAECCDASDICLPNGELGGKCCPSNERVCGDVCCDLLSKCVDPTRSLCCVGGTECGDTCCQIGEICSADDKCIVPEPTCDVACATKADCPGPDQVCVENCCRVEPK